jgi:hypothetical protein
MSRPHKCIYCGCESVTTDQYHTRIFWCGTSWSVDRQEWHGVCAKSLAIWVMA